MPQPKPPGTFVAIVGGNDVYWRVEAPARAIGAKTIIVPEKDAHNEFLNPNDDGAFRWQPVDDGYADYPDVEGTVVWTRPDPIRAVHADAMRQNGHLVVSEVDDNYLLRDPRMNVFTRANNFDREMQAEHLLAMASHDRIVFSTEWLRDRYWKEMCKAFPGKKLPEPFVCRNNIDRADWPEIVPRDGPLRVTWMGSPSHVWDVDIAWAAMLHARRNLGCETIVMGYDPSETQGDSERSLHKSAQWAKAISRAIPWQMPKDYHRQAVPADIGLCPLVRNDYTLGKSDVKALEYADLRGGGDRAEQRGLQPHFGSRGNGVAGGRARRRCWRRWSCSSGSRNCERRWWRTSASTCVRSAG